MVTKFNCGCCSQAFPIVRREIHHKCPRFLGGTDDLDNLIDLCEACHHVIHSTANSLFKGVNPNEGLLAYFNGNSKLASTCLSLASIIVDAKLNNEDAHREFSRPVVPIEFEYYNIHVKDAAKSLGLTVAEFMTSAIIEKTNSVLGLSKVNKLPSDNITPNQKVRRY